eukprot:TRINITY_DN3809_c0_g1_i7.p1 TRINITY_DN3809_c0_g1~~TRINITY_DN3809_c0_g1_i7.p1  ORF type:complete len:125 (+),score=5.45 TRINITY_DN3809_c0_g1_i7:71-445(+)
MDVVLGREELALIFSYLSVSDLGSCFVLSTRCLAAAKDDVMWCNRCRHDLHVFDLSEATWYHTYKGFLFLSLYAHIHSTHTHATMPEVSMFEWNPATSSIGLNITGTTAFRPAYIPKTHIMQHI